MAEQKSTDLANQQRNKLIEQLSSTYEDQEKKEVMRDCFVVLSLKTTTDRGSYTPRKLTPYEAFAYVVTNRQLGLNPLLDHVQVLEGKNYITLEGHLQNAQCSGDLISMKTSIVASKSEAKEFRYKCTIVKKTASGDQEFEAEGFANPATIAKKNFTVLFAEQMAEARAMRRCLKRAFPVGIAHAEDREVMESTVEIKDVVPEVTVDEWLLKINSISTAEELEQIETELPEVINSYDPEDRKKIAEALKRVRKEYEEVKEDKEQAEAEESKLDEVKEEIEAERKEEGDE